ncbi:MAG: DsbC family protein [Nitrospira sp. BO4]|nr:DsbC family protein [Nitrospira sp. BO4]
MRQDGVLSVIKRVGQVLCVSMLFSVGSETVSFAHPDLVDPEVNAARVAILKTFPGAIIQNWQPAPIPSMYMFTLNQDDRVFFVDQSGQYLLAQAALFDMKSQKNLTQDFILGKRREVLASMSLERAVVYAPSTADTASSTRTLYVFDDPDCPYCRELHPELKQLVASGVTVAVFLHPVERIHKGATQKSVNIWCSANRTESLDLALTGKAVPDVAKPCETPIEQNLTLARQLGGGPTPYIVFPDGRSIAGKKSAQELMSMLGMAPTLAQQLTQ